MLWLQSFDYQPGVSVALRDLDYGRLEGWRAHAAQRLGLLLGLVLLMVTSRWLLRSPTTQESAEVARRSYGAEFVIPVAGGLNDNSLVLATLQEVSGGRMDLRMGRGDGAVVGNAGHLGHDLRQDEDEQGQGASRHG